MNFQDFVNVCKILPTDISVLGQGDHGIGKSQLTYQLSEHFNLKVIERRLSQMSEGDMIGLPVVTGKSTAFLPPDWYLECCEEPRLLFLDELNRATPEVMQAAFQIVLDRTLNGHRLHPETRVYAMINTNARYNVNAMDPALLDRFWVAELEPTVEDWLIWATGKGKIHWAITDFIKAENKFLDTAGREVDATKVHPSRRSWERLSKIMDQHKLFDEPEQELIYKLAIGLIGPEASAVFTSFLKNMDKQVSATDILNNYSKMRKKIMKMPQERWNMCIDKIAEFLDKESMTEAHKPNLRAFCQDLPGELRISLWGKLVQGGINRIEQTKMVHSAIHDLILEVVTGPNAQETLNKVQGKGKADK